MTAPIETYRHTKLLIANQDVDCDDLYLMLLNDSAAFDAAHTAVSDVDNAGDYEVCGNGWMQRGIRLENLTWSEATLVNDARLSADNVSVRATGGMIGPAHNALIHARTLQKPLWFISFGQAHSAADSTDFKITWPAPTAPRRPVAKANEPIQLSEYRRAVLDRNAAKASP
jgi:hypothetical protein